MTQPRIPKNSFLNNPEVDVKVAVYMERLDTYIETSTELNRTLTQGLARVNDELDELKEWRTQFYGAKTFAVMLFAMFAHAGVVLAAVVGILNWYSKN
tara:strand:- start:104 stop:397 length:294 start_codon:yes stop_codon:yes gene_type:complete